MTASSKIQLQQLVDLQKMDDEISECRNILTDIPRQLNSARGELEEKKNILKVVMDEIEKLQISQSSMYIFRISPIFHVQFWINSLFVIS